MKTYIRVATFNIGSLYADEENRENTLLSILASANPDILCLQECPDVLSLRARIADACGASECLFVPCSESHVFVGHRMGIAVFSRLPLRLRRTVDLPKPVEWGLCGEKKEFLHPKKFCSASVPTPAGEWRLITGHGYPAHRYGLTAEQLCGPFAALDDFCTEEADGGFSTVIASDFNVPDPFLFLPGTAKTHKDIFAGQSTRPSGRKTDGILVPDKTEVLCTCNIPTPLDHHCLMAEISLPS